MSLQFCSSDSPVIHSHRCHGATKYIKRAQINFKRFSQKAVLGLALGLGFPALLVVGIMLVVIRRRQERGKASVNLFPDQFPAAVIQVRQDERAKHSPTPPGQPHAPANDRVAQVDLEQENLILREQVRVLRVELDVHQGPDVVDGLPPPYAEVARNETSSRKRDLPMKTLVRQRTVSPICPIIIATTATIHLAFRHDASGCGPSASIQQVAHQRKQSNLAEQRPVSSKGENRSPLRMWRIAPSSTIPTVLPTSRVKTHRSPLVTIQETLVAWQVRQQMIAGCFQFKLHFLWIRKAKRKTTNNN
ncbi:hypothetical protein C8F01DRAFT_1339445 [Mycena amicta]|nr:hypothetical protein C8F01DRAFT_1339445 [Mycena amicta]